jgi:hypothetical protein
VSDTGRRLHCIFLLVVAGRPYSFGGFGIVLRRFEEFVELALEEGFVGELGLVLGDQGRGEAAA